MRNKDQMQKEREILTKNLSFSLAAKRLGDRLDDPHYPIESLESMNEMAKALNFHGGYFQQNREIRDKRRSLDKALLYSYQGAFVRKLGCSDSVRALINPNKLKQDYDDKIISIGFEHGFHAGDVFEWVDTDTYWLIYLQQMTEVAYFRGEIRRCRYQISWKDDDGIKSTYAAVRGPVETKINYLQKHEISLDTPNYSLNILMPKNADTVKYFKRYAKFYLANTEEDDKVCWRVEAVDAISTPGIVEVTAVEYYSNEYDDDIENGIAGGLIKPVEVPNNSEIDTHIVGPTFIKPKMAYQYSTIDTSSVGSWSVDSGVPVKITVLDGKTIELTWEPSYSGQFKLKHGKFEKTIVVESLF